MSLISRLKAVVAGDDYLDDDFDELDYASEDELNGINDLKQNQKKSNALTNSNVHMYQSYRGLPELRKGISEFYKTHYQVVLDPNTEVLPLMGSKEGIMHISMAFLNPGDQVLIPNPGYPTYASVSRLLDTEPIFYSLSEVTNWQPDFKKLESLDTSKIKLCG